MDLSTTNVNLDARNDEDNQNLFGIEFIVKSPMLKWNVDVALQKILGHNSVKMKRNSSMENSADDL